MLRPLATTLLLRPLLQQAALEVVLQVHQLLRLQLHQEMVLRKRTPVRLPLAMPMLLLLRLPRPLLQAKV